MERTIAPVLQMIFNPSNLKAQYWDQDAEQLLRDGLKADNLVVKVGFGCAGCWYANFVHNGHLYVVFGSCDACPQCASDDENDQGITDPIGTLERWLQGADVRMATSIEEAHASILANPNTANAEDLRFFMKRGLTQR